MSVILQSHRDDGAARVSRELSAAGLPVAAAAVVLTILLACVYAPVMQVDFLYRDDNVYLTLPRGWNLTPITLAQARPLMGVVIDCLNTSVVSGAGGKYVLPIVGLGLLATSLFVWLVRHEVHVLTALPLSISACCLPAFQGAVPYLSVTVAMYAALSSSLAVHSWFAAGLRNAVARGCLSFALIFAALSAYQPAAMFGWALLVVPLFVAKECEWPLFRRRLLWFCLLFGSTMAVYAVAYKSLLYGLGMSMSGRSQAITIDLLPDKFHWLACTLMPHTIRSVVTPLLAGAIPPSSVIVLAAVLVAAGGLVAHVGCGSVAACCRWSERIGWLGTFLLMAYLPFVILRENGAEPIYATGLQTAVLLVLFLGGREIIRGIWHGMRASMAFGARAEYAVAAIVCLCMASSAGRTVLQEIVFPCHNRYRFIARTLAEGDLARIRHIYVVADDGFLGAYAEGLVRGVLNERCVGGPSPEVFAASRTAPPYVHLSADVAAQIYGKEFGDYYDFDSINHVHVLKPALTPAQRAAADDCFVRFLTAGQSSSDTLVIDLPAAVVSY
ncbi:MAG: hypothetical protein ACKO6B_00685 [Planctomycetia bacterium]